MSNEQQLGQSFGSAVIGNVPAGQALELSGKSADELLGLGNDPFVTNHENSNNQQPALQLDGCALNAK